MKKIGFSLCITVLFILSLCFHSSAIEVYGCDEIDFTTPDYMMADEYEDKWTSEDGSIEMYFYYRERDPSYDNFDSMDTEDFIEYYYTYYFIDQSDFELTNAVPVYNGADGFRIDGVLNNGDDECQTVYCMFYTEKNVYEFQFIISGETDYAYCIDEIIGSCHFTYDDEYYEYDASDDYHDSQFDELFGIISFILFSGSALVVKYITKKLREKNSVHTEMSVGDVTVPGAKAREYKLNDKNVNKYNERFIVGGSKGDNYALNELEKERRERKNMYKDLN